MEKPLFVCTKPYQYLIARLIKEGRKYKSCDILILNHFYKSREFAESIRELGIWDNVFYEDDSSIIEYVKNLPYYKKFFYYKNWRDIIPPIFYDIEQYNKLYIAHDTVVLEYALMKKFSSENKDVYLFEEGTGNYINTNFHKSFVKRIIREFSYIVGMPSSYLGRSKEVKAILLSRPEIIKRMRYNPVKRKVMKLPLELSDFLNKQEIREEFYHIYPELHYIEKDIKNLKEISIILTEPQFDTLTNREFYLRKIIDKAQRSNDEYESVTLIKQHPGETKDLPKVEGIGIIPKNIPIEMIKIIKNEKLKKINLFTFGSTAVFTIKELFKKDIEVNIFLIDDENQQNYFKKLANKFDMEFKCIDI